jgi:hypothetical protein
LLKKVNSWMCFESRFSKELIAIWSALMKMAVLGALCVLCVSKILAGSAKRNAKSASKRQERQGRIAKGAKKGG